MWISGDETQPADTVQWLTPEDDAEWDAFVKWHPNGLVYHLSRWKRLIEESFPHIRARILVLRNGATGSIQAGLPVYTVRSWLLGDRIVSVPFASLCDPLILKAQEFEMLLPCVLDLSKGLRSRAVEIRSMETQQLISSSLTAKARYKHHYLALDKSEQALFASFAKSSVCQKVNKARRAGVTVEAREDEEGLRICYSILVETRRRLSLPPMPFELFRGMKRHLGEHCLILLAMLRGTPVGCHLILRFKDLWISEYSGSTDDAMHGVNQLLYWETIQRARAGGAARFSFGRTSVDNENLLAYKRRWATVEEEVVCFAGELQNVPNPIAAKSHDVSRAYRVVKLLLANAPLPVYRWMGHFCYRHLG
jgi:CelD/BcsL family acetyltransferase involved in cellulose biosynthesis